MLLHQLSTPQYVQDELSTEPSKAFSLRHNIEVPHDKPACSPTSTGQRRTRACTTGVPREDTHTHRKHRSSIVQPCGRESAVRSSSAALSTVIPFRTMASHNVCCPHTHKKSFRSLSLFYEFKRLGRANPSNEVYSCLLSHAVVEGAGRYPGRKPASRLTLNITVLVKG